MDNQSLQAATALFYVCFDLFCALIMGILLYTTLSDVERSNKRVHLTRVLITVILYCVVDSIWMLAYSDYKIPRTVVSRYLTNIIMYTVMAICAYTISRFLFSIWESVSPKKTLIRNLIFTPFALALLAIFTTCWTHLVFSIDEGGNLVKGALYLPLMILLFGYVIVFGATSLGFFFSTQNDFAKEQYFLVAIYTVPVIVGALVHYFYWSIPSFAIGFTVATLIIYIFQMRDLISLDALTGISNRRQGERFFLEQIKQINESPYTRMECLYLFMMDLNKFKAINDTYGHTEGDRALVATAEVLKEACAHIRRRCIMSRFGGDEFVIGVMFTPDEAQILSDKIYDLIEKKNAELNAPYKISISVGYTYYKKSFADFRTFLSNADKLMYEMKAIVHREDKLNGDDER